MTATIWMTWLARLGLFLAASPEPSGQAPATTSAVGAAIDAARAEPAAGDQRLPRASAPLTVPAPSTLPARPTRPSLVEELRCSGGVALHASPARRMRLAPARLGLLRAAEVPAGAWRSFAAARSRASRPETNERNALRRPAFHVAPQELEAWSDPRAVRITSLVHAPLLLARRAASASRRLLTEASTQRSVPLGERVLLLTTHGRKVAALARELRRADLRAASDGPASPESPSAER